MTKIKKINEKVLEDVFDIILGHFEFMNDECRADLSRHDFNRYLIGARYALFVASGRDFETDKLIEDVFKHKFDEYFGGKESE